MDDGFKVYHLILIFFIAILVLCISLYCYRRYAKRHQKFEMNKQIAEAVNHYVALSSTDTEINQSVSKSKRS